MMCGVASADTTIQTARKSLFIKDGSTVQRDSFWTGTIENLDNVTFVGWNFSRKTPQTEVFKNCTNLTFIDCNLVNVKLQSDFIIKGGLAIQKRTYEKDGKNYNEVECADGKTRTYEIIVEQENDVDTKYSDLTKAQKDKIKQDFTDNEIEYQRTTTREVLSNVKKTTNSIITDIIR